MKRKFHRLIHLSYFLELAVGAQILTVSSAHADPSVSPYIDDVKKSIEAQQPPSESYSEKIRKNLPQDSSEGYTQSVRESEGLQKSTPSSAPEKSYTSELKKQLEPQKEGGAIEALQSGKSDLEVKKPGAVHHAVGFRMGFGLSRSIDPGNLGTTRSFDDVYGGNYAPDFALYYEAQFLRSESFGSLGFFGMGEVAFFSGKGNFATTITDANTNLPVAPDAANVRFQFFEVPVSVGLSYRFRLAKYICPYVMGGPTLVGLSETRNDGFPSHKALDHGFWGTGGVSLLMDWVNSTSDWDRYSEYGIKHTYFSVEYNKLSTFSSPVTVSVSGVFAGFSFEY